MAEETQINVGMNVDGVATGVNKAKTELRSLQAEVDKVAALSKKGGDALGKLPEGVDPAKAIKAFNTISNGIKRVSEEAVLGRNSVELFTAKFEKAGISKDVYKPIIDAYGQVRTQVDLANGAFTQSGKVLNEYGMGAKATAAALRQVPAQLTDIVVSLQGGQAPLTVFLQQGGQLRDVFGSASGALRAMAGTLVKLINPFTIAAGVVATLGLAYKQATDEVDVYRKALVLSGNDMGLSIGGLQRMAESISSTSGTVGAAAGALGLMAASSNVAAGGLEKATLSAIRFEKYAGVAIKDSVKAFADLANEPVQASERLNKQYNYLTASIYSQIKALEEQGDKAGAVALAQDQLANAQNRMSADLEAGLGRIEQAWNLAGKAASSAWDKFVGLGRPDPIEKVIAELETRLSFGKGMYGFGQDKAKIQEELDYWRHIKASQDDYAANQKRIAEQTSSQISLDKAWEAGLGKAERAQRAIAKLSGEFAKADQTPENQAKYAAAIQNILKGAEEKVKVDKAGNRELEKQAELLLTLSGYSKDYTEDVKRLVVMREKGTLNEEAYLRAVNELVAKQPGMVALNKENAAAIKEASKAYDDAAKASIKYYEGMAKDNASLEKSNEKLKEEVEAIGMSASAKERLNEARSEAAIVIAQEQLALMNLQNSSEMEIQQAERQIELLKEQASLRRQGVVRTEANDLAKANKKAAEESSKYWEDALMRAFESGKGFFESLWSTIKNTLKTQVLKIIIAPIAGAISGVASAATGGVLGGAAAGSLLGGAAASAGTGTLTSLLGATGMGSLDIAGFAVGGPAGIAVAAAAAALYAIFGNKKTPSAGTGEGNMSFDASGNVTGSTSRYSGSWGLTTEVEKTLQSLSTSYLAAAQSLGIGAVAAEFGYGGNTGKEGKDPQFALGVNAGGVGYSSGEIKLTDENVQLAASRAILAALQGSEIPTYLEGVFDGLTASTATQDQITAVLENAKAYKDFHTALSAMPWDNLTSMSYAAVKGLSEASGGLEALGNNLAGFYQSFYTDAEQTANLTRVLGDTFESLGLSMPVEQLREWYRGQVEAAMALDQSVPANQAYLAGLLSIQSGVNNLATSAEEAAQRIIDAAAKLEAEIVSAQDSAMQEYMSAQLEYNSLIASEQESAAQAMQDAAEAIQDAMASAGQGIVQFIQSLLNTPTNAAANYRTDLALAQQGDVEASKRLPTSGRAYLDTQINSSATAYEAARATAKMVQELNALPAVKTYEQQLLEAVGGTTSAVGGTTDAIKNMNSKITAELSVTARSEILKLINFVANTDLLPDDLKEIALKDASTFSKTISFIQGSFLTPENMQLALMTETEVVKTYNFVAGSELNADQKQQAFGVLTDADRTVSVVTGSMLSDDAKQQAFDAVQDVTRTVRIVADSTALAEYKTIALDVTADATKQIRLAATGFSSADAQVITAASSSVTKTVAVALGNNDPWALAIATAQSGTIDKVLKASGGVLTPEQSMLLNGITDYEKNIKLGITVDRSQLTDLQTQLMQTFGTIDISALASSGIDISSIVSTGAQARLASIATYIQGLNWDAQNAAASSWATYDAARAYGVSQTDIANAMGYTLDDIRALFSTYGIPNFAVGTNSLPRDMLAQVHQGERIIPAADNRELMSRLQDPQQNSEALVAEVRALRDDNAAQARAMVQLQQRLTKLMERWDSNGLPSERLET